MGKFLKYVRSIPLYLQIVIALGFAIILGVALGAGNASPEMRTLVVQKTFLSLMIDGSGG